MPVFMVVRSGNWSYGHPVTKRHMQYPQGMYEADETTVRFARRSGNSQLVLVEATEPPEVYADAQGVLHVVRREDERVVLAPDGVQDEWNQGASFPKEWRCGCGASFPSRGSLQMHRTPELRDCPDLLWEEMGGVPLSRRVADA